jgi:hypothetical protein
MHLDAASLLGGLFPSSFGDTGPNRLQLVVKPLESPPGIRTIVSPWLLSLGTRMYPESAWVCATASEDARFAWVGLPTPEV